MQTGEEGSLEFGRDVNACRYVNGARETPNEEVHAPLDLGPPAPACHCAGSDSERVQAADEETLRAKYAEGCTLQVHQPQRWAPNVARLVRALERRLGCLVGANAYLTPPGKVSWLEALLLAARARHARSGTG